ncbi:MAG TPA: CbiQ family ECF transporter T component [Acidimicrobiales bacterium]|jgi:energy-coupling factor transport system permease protein
MPTTRAVAPAAASATAKPSSSTRTHRELHPGAWWIWALGMATFASRTTNPLLLALVLAVVGLVVVARRGDSPWSQGFGMYVAAALAVIAVRVVFRILLDAHDGGHVLFHLPEIPLPAAAAGIRLGGPVSLEGVLAAFYDGLRLATLLLCVGAANVLANAKRLLKGVPSALQDLSVAVTVALTLAPQLIESTQRVRRARRLRSGAGRGTHLLRQILIPVMTDALDRSLLLAAAMDARGRGRTVAEVGLARRRISAGLLLTGLIGVCIGTYGLLDGTTPDLLGTPALIAGLAATAGGFVVGRHRLATTRYRPDPWRGAEWEVAAVGVAVVLGSLVAGAVDPAGLNPSLDPLQWPTLPLVATLTVLIGALPAWLAPPPVVLADRPPAGDRGGDHR